MFNEIFYLLLCTIYFVGIGTFDGDMPPPPLDTGDEETGEDAQKGEVYPQGGVGIQACRMVLRFRMNYCNRLAKVLIDVGVC